MSSEYPRREEKSPKNINKTPMCRKCNIEMEESILYIHYPIGTLPVVGHRCKKCDFELISLEEARYAQDLAEKLGMYGDVGGLTRTITKSGGQLAFYIPKEIQKELHLKKGMKVRVSLRGDDIVLTPQ